MTRAMRPDTLTDPVIWVHADCQATVRTFLNLARKVEESGHQVCFVITADPAALERVKPRPNTILSPLPALRSRDLRVFFESWRPVLGYWIGAPLSVPPLKQAMGLGVPMVLLNASEDIAETTSGFFQRRAVQKLLPQFRVIFTDTHISGGICLRLGVDESKVQVTGRLTEGSMALPCNVDELDDLAASIVGRDVWLAAEVPMDELDTVLTAHESLRAGNRRLLLILNTSQLESEETLAIELAAKGWRVAMRDKGDPITDHTQIYLSCDTDEMGLWYRLAPVTYVGGTFSIQENSADPLQAAALGSAILHGPRTAPYREAFDQLIAQIPAASTQVVNPGSLARAVESLLSPHIAAEQANAAWEFVSRGAELTDNVIALVEEAVMLADEQAEQRDA